MSHEYKKNVESAVGADQRDAGCWHSTEGAEKEPANLTFDRARNLVENSATQNM